MEPHATLAQLETYLGEAPPASGARLLQRATELIDSHVFGHYDIDSVTELPTETKVIQALRDATCAQVEWWLATGDEKEATSRFTHPGIGSLNLVTTGRRLAPRAVDHLNSVRLLEAVIA